MMIATETFRKKKRGREEWEYDLRLGCLAGKLSKSGWWPVKTGSFEHANVLMSFTLHFFFIKIHIFIPWSDRLP